MIEKTVTVSIEDREIQVRMWAVDSREELPVDAKHRIVCYEKAFADLRYHFNLLQLRFSYGLVPSCSLTGNAEQSQSTIVYVDTKRDPRVSYHDAILHQAVHYLHRSKNHNAAFVDKLSELTHKYVRIKMDSLVEGFNHLLSLHQQIVITPGDQSDNDLLSILSPMLALYSRASEAIEALPTSGLGLSADQAEWKSRTNGIIWATLCQTMFQYLHTEMVILHDVKELERFLLHFLREAVKQKGLIGASFLVAELCTRVLAAGGVNGGIIDIDFWWKYSDLVVSM